LTVETIKDFPVALSGKRHLSWQVAAGRSEIFSSSSFLVIFGLRRSATALSRRKGVTLLDDSHVTLHGGEAHAEQASGLGLGHTFFDGFYDPDSQIFGNGASWVA
jgi:hypothetical protein